jgi:antirestriction protein ArdC
MANYFGKAENTARAIVKAFESGQVPNALSQVFVSGMLERHCSKYSYMNQFIVAIHGYSDCMGFKQWKKEGRNVKKGEKSFGILAPCLRKTGEKDANGKDRSICIGFKAVTVFGYEQTEGKPRVEDPNAVKFLEELPFIEVAKAWGLEVSAYNGKEGQALGYYAMGNSINMGVENVATWAHELAHASDDRLGNLNPKKMDRALAEVVAEFAGAVILKMLGKDEEADLGGAYNYIKTWAERDNLKLEDACRKVLGRVCDVVDNIMVAQENLKEIASEA